MASEPHTPLDPALRISRRAGQLGLVALLLFFLAWDLWAVLADQRLGTDTSDSTLVDFFRLQFFLREASFGEWLTSGYVKGPAATLLIWLLEPLVDDWLLAARLTSVMAHVALLWLVCRLTVRLSRNSHLLGLVAVAICGSFPMEYGWFRMDFHEPLVAVAVVASLLVMLHGVERPVAAARLGLVVGLGALTKMTFPMFLLFPGAWFLARNLRHRRRALHLGLAALAAAVVMAWWAVPTLGLLQQYLVDSTGRYPASASYKLQHYLLELPGSAPLLAAGLVGAALAWRGRLARGADLLPLVLCVVSSVAMLILVFDPWSRYIVPVYPVAGALAALGVGRALVWARGKLPGGRALVLGLLGAALLGQYLWFNLAAGKAMIHDRVHTAGIVSPDTRPHDAYVRAVGVIRKNGWRVLRPLSYHIALPALWHRRGVRPPELTMPQALAAHRRGRPVYVLLPQGSPGESDPPTFTFDGPEEEDEELARLYRWLKAQRSRMKVAREFVDPDGATYYIIRIDAPR